MKRILFFVILGVSILIMSNLLRSIYSLLQKHTLLEAAFSDAVRVQAENTALKKQLEVVNGPLFVENEARSKLLLSREHEAMVVLPKESQTHSFSKQNGQKESPLAAWWSLFF